MRLNGSDCSHGTRLLPSILHHSPSSRPGGRVAPSATGRFQTQTVATSLTTTRPIVLDCLTVIKTEFFPDKNRLPSWASPDFSRGYWQKAAFHGITEFPHSS